MPSDGVVEWHLHVLYFNSHLSPFVPAIDLSRVCPMNTGIGLSRYNPEKRIRPVVP